MEKCVQRPRGKRESGKYRTLKGYDGWHRENRVSLREDEAGEAGRVHSTQGPMVHVQKLYLS